MARKTPDINASSQADIAFLLLVFFLITTTMDVDKGISRKLPPMPEENQQQEDVKINRRNIIVVKINSADRLLAGNEPIDVSQLKDKIKEFLNVSEDRYPGVKKNVMESFKQILTFENDIPARLNECELCGEPTSSNVCKACELKESLEF